MFYGARSKKKKLSYVEEIVIYDRILKFFDTMNNYTVTGRYIIGWYIASVLYK